MTQLVLSLFPGIGLFDMAFEEEGFCIVRGPDLLWGGDIKRFHPPAGKFDGIIGGPPCQLFSRLRHLCRHAGQKHGNLIPEFERVVHECRPQWFVMENVPEAPEPHVVGYIVKSYIVCDVWLGGITNRRRRFCSGTPDGRDLPIEYVALHSIEPAPTVLASAGGKTRIRGTGMAIRQDRSRNAFKNACVLQGLPPDFLANAPFTHIGKQQVLGNGVPLPMGRAIAKAITAIIRKRE